LKLRAGFSLVITALLALAVLATGCAKDRQAAITIGWLTPTHPSTLTAAGGLQPASASALLTPTAPSFGNINGYWTGTWNNSLGQSGTETLRIADSRNGSFTGVWSGATAISGRWLTNNTFQFNAFTPTRTYQVQGSVQGLAMSLTYTATPLDSTGSYTGQEKLNRIDSN
jgi:hypothetical protein